MQPAANATSDDASAAHRAPKGPVDALIRRLGGAPKVAEGVGLAASEEGARVVRAWVFRDSIPAEWFTALARFASTEGFPDVTERTLSLMAQARRRARSGTSTDLQSTG
jgi:hypothetical protein